VSRRSKIMIGVGILAVLLIAGLAALAWYLSRDTAPPPVTLPECGVDEGFAAESGATAQGEWVAVKGEETFVGYRIEESFGGDTFLREIGGRTPAVEASVEVEGDTIPTASVLADVAELKSDQARRDRFLEANGLQTTEFTEASFTLTAPIELDAPPLLGREVSAAATGDLELHGVTRQVVVPIEACWHGGSADITGSVPILLADYDIEPPHVPGLAKSEPDGILEFQLTLERS
jgi:polyisoprenoid-binding protein YceI